MDQLDQIIEELSKLKRPEYPHGLVRIPEESQCPPKNQCPSCKLWSCLPTLLTEARKAQAYREALGKVRDDFVPHRAEQASLALNEMRECATNALEGEE